MWLHLHGYWYIYPMLVHRFASMVVYYTCTWISHNSDLESLVMLLKRYHLRDQNGARKKIEMNWITVNILPPGHRHFLEPNNGRCIVCSWGTSISNYCTSVAVLWPFCAIYLFPCRLKSLVMTTILFSWNTSQEDVEVYYEAYLCLAMMLAESDLKVEVIVIGVCMVVDGVWSALIHWIGLLLIPSTLTV